MRADDQKFLLESADRAMTALVDAAVRLGFISNGQHAGLSNEFSAAMQHVDEARKTLRFRTEVEP